MAIKEFNEYVIKDERVEVIALPFRDGVNIVQRRCDFSIAGGYANSIHTAAMYTLKFLFLLFMSSLCSMMLQQHARSQHSCVHL